MNLIQINFKVKDPKNTLRDKKSVMNQTETLIKAKGSCVSLSDLLAYSAAKAVFTAKMPPVVTKFIQNCEKSCRQG